MPLLHRATALVRCLLTLATLGLAPPALAQVPGSGPPLAPFGDESVAVTGDARAALVNPAAIGLRYPSELFIAWAHERSQERWLGAATWRDVALGFEREAGVSQRGFAAVGAGDERLRLGWSAQLLMSDEGDHRTVTHTFGALSRPAPWLSLGATLANPGQPRFRGTRRGREFGGGVALRPLALARTRAFEWGPRLTLSADVALREGEPHDAARLRFGVGAEVVPGVVLRAALEDHGGARLGITLLGTRGSYHGGGASRDARPGAREAHALSLHAGEERTVLVGPRERRIAVIRVAGSLADEALAGGAVYGGSATTPVAALHRQLERALEDPLTRGVLLELSGVGNTAQIDELRQRIARLRAARKPVVAYLETGGGRGDLLLAAACTAIVTTADADFMALGLRVEKRYWREFLAEFGLRVDRASVGRFKSAYREWSVDSIPDADRESLEYQLDAAQRIFVSTVAADRRMNEARLLTLLDGRRWPAATLVSAGLIDSVGYREDALALLGRAAELGERPRTVRLARVAEARRAWTVPTRVAVVYASGEITTGASANDFLFGSTLGARSLTAQLERAFRARSTRAVVLRIESPGGSSVASDLMQHAVARLVRETGKPLVVSMGGVAASGGYHLAIDGRPIFAGRATRTGSIGVLFLHPSLEGFYTRHRVRQQDFERGEFMRGSSPARDWDASLQASADSSIGHLYRRFVGKVAHARGLSEAHVDSAAQGRVWFGAQALELGLVDRLGSLEDAIGEARRQANIPEGEKIRVAEYRRPRPALVERLLGSLVRESWMRTLESLETPRMLQRAEDLVEP